MKERDLLSSQLIKLGDMMGEGLHYEHGGEWISKEYNRILRTLYPEFFAEQRKNRAKAVNQNMANLISEKRCKCGGKLKQARSGSKVAYCIECGARYKACKANKMKR